MSKNPTLYLVDGSSYLYRAFHALPNLTNSRGEPTGALLGVANMLKRLLNEDDPDYIAVVFDAKGPTFRHELYPAYKANRPPMPAELRQQVEAILDFTRLLGLPLLQVDGVEADDVIGTLAAAAEKAGMNCVISTGDKDMAQLVTDHTTLTNTMTNTDMDRGGVKAKFDVTPEQFVDFLALTGDSSDNIPGVEKCGPKTAAKWLGTWGSLDEVIDHADDVGGKIGENLRASLEQLPLSRELARIRKDLELERTPKSLKREKVDEQRLAEALKRYEFNSWLQEMDQKTSSEPMKTDYRTITTFEQLESLIKELAGSELIAFDTETTSLDYMAARIVGVSFAVESGKAAYVPLAQHRDLAPAMLDGLEGLDLIAIDDVQCVTARLPWEQALFALFNRCLDRDTRLLFSGDRGPAALPLRLPDLRSRLASGLTLALKPLDDRGRLALLQSLAARHALSLPDEIARYVLTRSSRDPGDLIAIIQRLDRASLAEQRRLTIPFVKEVLG